MFHSNTQRLIDHWRGLQTGRGAPDHRQFDPVELAPILSHLFMLDRSAGLPFRLAGALVEDLHGRSLKGQSFLGLWAAESRAAAREAVVGSEHGAEPVVLYTEAATASDQRAGLEITLAPLADDRGRTVKFLGLCQPVTTLVRLHGETLLAYRHKLTLFAGEEETTARAPRLRLAAVDGRRIA